MRLGLSLCGGGIRGVIQALVLAEIERQTGKRVRDLFEWTAGTSVGACIAALAQGGVPMKDALDLFTGDAAKKIFNPTGILATAKRAVRGWMYDPQNLADALKSSLGDFAKATINDCPSCLMLTAVDMSGHTWYFVPDDRHNSSKTGTVSLVDAAVASAAAPTYFKPWPIMLNGQRRFFFDGGVGGVGNPGHQLCKEMFLYGGLDPKDYRVICVGTGYYPHPMQQPPTGLLATVGWSLSALLDSAADDADIEAQEMFPEPSGYIKLNWQLPRDIDMDAIGSIGELVDVGREAVKGLDWRALIGKDSIRESY